MPAVNINRKICSIYFYFLGFQFKFHYWFAQYNIILNLSVSYFKKKLGSVCVRKYLILHIHYTIIGFGNFVTSQLNFVYLVHFYEM